MSLATPLSRSWFVPKWMLTTTPSLDLDQCVNWFFLEDLVYKANLLGTDPYLPQLELLASVSRVSRSQLRTSRGLTSADAKGPIYTTFLHADKGLLQIPRRTTVQ